VITDVQSRKMAVLSDLHLGNPFCKTKRRVIDFLYWASDQGYDLCINGDGFEVAQVSFSKLARDVPDVLHALKVIANRGRRIYYIIGNHDMTFEHFLDDWGSLKMAPFLNVTSGESRIRVEHGHLYDPFFIKYPRLYEWTTIFAGFFLAISPRLYKLWIRFEEWKSARRAKRGEAITGESPRFAQAALELSRRGFDHVVFGHTHHVGHVDLGQGRGYWNPGSWMIGTDFITIEDGQVSLKRWDRRVEAKPFAAG
jgi:UDP-2,3-diacylglucosamine pyrophosphatase LpxH